MLQQPLVTTIEGRCCRSACHRSGRSKSPTRISNRTSKSSCEQQDGSGIEEGCCRLECSFEVLGEAAAAPKPGKEAFHHPAPGMHGKADLAGLLAHDLDDDPGCGRHPFGAIGAIGETRSMKGYSGREACSNGMAPSRSWTEAAWTWRISPRPSVSTMASRLRPLIFLPAS